MNIAWKIIKKRGNHRPVLEYTITLSEYEKSLCVPAIRVTSTIPKPPDAGWNFCWPDQNERGSWSPTEWYCIMSPSHRTGEITESVKLPWRENNTYPEVEESFKALRITFEETMQAASASAPINIQGALETSAQAKSAIAPAFAAERFLQAVGKQ